MPHSRSPAKSPCSASTTQRPTRRESRVIPPARPPHFGAALTGYSRLADHYDFDIGSVRPDHVVDCGDVPGDPGSAGQPRRDHASRAHSLDADAIPVVLGGDDSVPIPMFRAFEGRGPLTVVQIDVHLDWRDEVRGEKMAGAARCAARPRCRGSGTWCR